MRLLVLAAALAAAPFVATAALAETDHDPVELECIFQELFGYWDEAGRAVAGLPVAPERLTALNARSLEGSQACMADYGWNEQELILANEYAQINSVRHFTSNEIVAAGITNFKEVNGAFDALSQAERDHLVGGGLNSDPAFKAAMEDRARQAGVPEHALEAAINYFAVSVRVEQLKAAWDATSGTGPN